MSTRNMIEANKKIFLDLDEYCAIRLDPVRNAKKPRWIATNATDKAFLINASAVARLSLAPTIKLVHYNYDSRSFIIVSGLDLETTPQGFNFEEIGGGVLTLFLSEELPTPIVSTAGIRNTVEVDDLSSNPAYMGHQAQQIASLFPSIQFFSTAQLESGESYKAFLMLALTSRQVMQTKSESLVKTLRTLVEVSSPAVPYRTICRSVMDSDPSSMFLAFYRCLEALYAYTHAQSLKTKLGLAMPWAELARTLEEHLEWRPREEPSLASILSFANVEKLRNLAAAFRLTIPDNASESSFIAKRVYSLRNSAVHYRPFHQNLPQEDWDWSQVTEAMAMLMFDLYGNIPLETMINSSTTDTDKSQVDIRSTTQTGQNGDADEHAKDLEQSKTGRVTGRTRIVRDVNMIAFGIGLSGVLAILVGRSGRSNKRRPGSV